LSNKIFLAAEGKGHLKQEALSTHELPKIAGDTITKHLRL